MGLGTRPPSVARIEEPWVAPARHRLVLDPRGPLLEASRRCEADVFLRRFGNTREQLEEEYAPFEAQSVFLSLVADDDEVTATARLIAPGPAGLKTLLDCSAEPWHVSGAEAAQAVGLDPAGTWDVATISARGRVGRDVMASAALYHGLVLTARANDVSGMVAVLDDRVRGLLTGLGLHYRPLPGTWAADYLGSPSSTPVYAHFGRMLDEQRQSSPDGYRLVTLGIGLDGVSVPPVPAFRRRAVDLRGSSAAQPAQRQPVGGVQV